MKKRILITAFSLALALSLTGCGVLSHDPSIEDVTPAGDATGVDTAGKTQETPVPEEPFASGKLSDEEFAAGAYVLKEGELFEVKEPTDIVYWDMKITIPSEYAGRVYALGGEYGLCIHQKASYDYEEGMGFLFAFLKYENNVPNYANEYMKAYTPDMVYYVDEPSDVPFVFDDEDISDDYIELADIKDEVIDSLVINEENVRYDAEEFVMPMTSYKVLEDDTFMYENLSLLIEMRDEIFARHGKVFDDYHIQCKYEALSWYEASDKKIGYDDLNDVEKENVDKLSDRISEDLENRHFPAAVGMGNEYTAEMTEGEGEVTVSVSIDDTPGEPYDGVISVNGKEYKLSDLGVEPENPYMDEYFISNLRDYADDKEIFIIDQGMDDNAVTFFFRVTKEAQNGAVDCIGMIYGSPVEETAAAAIDGFSGYYDVVGTKRSSLIPNVSYYINYFYNTTEGKLQSYDAYPYYYMVPDKPFTMKKDMTVYTDVYKSAPATLKAGTQIYLVGTDDSQWIVYKTKESPKKRYIYVDEDMAGNLYNYMESTR